MATPPQLHEEGSVTQNGRIPSVWSMSRVVKGSSVLISESGGIQLIGGGTVDGQHGGIVLSQSVMGWLHMPLTNRRRRVSVVPTTV